MTATAAPATVRASLRGRRADVRATGFQLVLLGCLLFSLAVLVTLIGDVLGRGLGVLVARGPDFLASGTATSPLAAGVAQGILGSFLIALVTAVVAFPVGILTAVYLEEYAGDTRLARFLSVNIRNLAGVPSVVYGLFGLSIFVEALGGVTGGRSIIAGGLTLAVLVLPIVIITSAEALRAVPNAIREAGYGVGASRWEVTRSLVLPSAAPGILTGTVLSISRALGETAPLLLVGAILGYFAAGGGSAVDHLRGDFTALPVLVFDWARRPEAEFRQLTAAAIIVLLVMTLFTNAAAILLRNRFERHR